MVMNGAAAVSEGKPRMQRDDGTVVNIADKLSSVDKRLGGGVTWVREATLNASAKTFTVPAGKVWELVRIYAEILTTATVGNRTLGVTITDGSNNIIQTPKTASIAANSNGNILWAVWPIVQGTTAANNLRLDGSAPAVSIYGPIPRILLPAGYIVKIWDTAAIDAGADDLTVVLHYIESDA